MNKINVEDSFEKIKEASALYKIEESTESESKPLTIIRCGKKKRFNFYCTNNYVSWNGNFKDKPKVWDFYFIPMLRYLHQGEYAQYIQFRWLIWGINFRVK